MNDDLISRSEAEKLGATCLAKRNENGQLEAVISLDNAPTVDDERIGRVLGTIQTVIDNTNGNMDNVSKAIRNTAKFIRNAIDEGMPDYENVEGEDCGERPTGEWILHGMIYYCSECGHECGESGDNFCGNCGAIMK